MELSDLASYAEEKYHIKEEHKWTDFPGFSVLADPQINKWAALLMRQWDYETGTELQRCDIKCGRQALEEFNVPWLSGPFRMKGKNWVGAALDERTDPDIVFQLFDRAIRAGRKGGYTIVLDGDTRSQDDKPGGRIYSDTLLPLEPLRGNYPGKKDGFLRGNDNGKKAAQTQDRDLSGRDPGERRGAKNSVQPGHFESHRIGAPERAIPPRILEMMQLYEYGSSSFESKCRNFYIQGRFMEDYEDYASWSGEYKRYFTTYHDLNLNLLRGYFAWRTFVRRGEFRRITASLAYMYIYELLNGIGTDSPENALQKMVEFEKGYLDAGLGDEIMRDNLKKWKMEFAVIKGLSADYVLPYLDRDMLERDEQLLKLRSPNNYSDEEVFASLSALSGGKIEKSSAVLREPSRSRHLFAEVWRYMAEHYEDDGWDIFTACFGKLGEHAFHPLANAVYYEEQQHEDTEYVVNECRKYICKSGCWREAHYEQLFFDKYRIHAVMHEADRQIRRYLKTGHYLRAKEEEEWISPYVEAVLAADRQAAVEAAKPRISIDLAGLDRIRQDAQITRDSLLTGEEAEGEAADLGPAVLLPQTAEPLQPQEPVKTADPPQPVQPAAAVRPPLPEIAEDQYGKKNKTSVRNGAECATIKVPALDEVHAGILLRVMRGESAADLIRRNHLMPSVVTDTINEALFDEIGDNVLECEGDEITLVEDYREDLMPLLGGDS